MGSGSASWRRTTRRFTIPCGRRGESPSFFGLLTHGVLRTPYQAHQANDFVSTISTFGWVSALSASTAAKLLSDAKYLRNQYLPQFRRRLTKRRAFVEEELEKYDIPHVKAEAGFFVFVNLSEWVDLLLEKHGKQGDLKFVEYLMKYRVYLEPGQVSLVVSVVCQRCSGGGSGPNDAQFADDR